MLTLTSKFQLVGFHHWPNPPEQYEYLGFPHRHVFYFSVEYSVTEANREIEFIDFGDNVKSYIRESMPGHLELIDAIDFGGMSCEMIATWLYEMLATNPFYQPVNIKSISVFEDNENGATYYAN